MDTGKGNDASTEGPSCPAHEDSGVARNYYSRESLSRSLHSGLECSSTTEGDCTSSPSTPKRH